MLNAPAKVPMDMLWWDTVNQGRGKRIRGKHAMEERKMKAEVRYKSEGCKFPLGRWVSFRIPVGWRILGSAAIIREGDLRLDPSMREWVLSRAIGARVGRGCYIRKIPD